MKLLALANSSKQQQAQSTATVQASSVLYIDTERKFSPKRLLQILAGMQRQSSAVASSQILNRVLVICPSSLTDLSAKLKVNPSSVFHVHSKHFIFFKGDELALAAQELEAAVIEHSVALVVLDSIAALARTEQALSIQERQMQLGQPLSYIPILSCTDPQANIACRKPWVQ